MTERRPRARLVRAIVTVAGPVLLATACGSSTASPSKSASAGTSTSAQAETSPVLAFSRCMRSHGVREFPDPPASGKLVVPSAQTLGVGVTQLQTAQNACRDLLPNGGSGPSRGEVQQEWSEFRSFARCMRRDGVPSWPDPSNRSATDPRPIFRIQPVDPASPIDPNAPQIRSKLHKCDSLLRTANPNRL